VLCGGVRVGVPAVVLWCVANVALAAGVRMLLAGPRSICCAAWRGCPFGWALFGRRVVLVLQFNGYFVFVVLLTIRSLAVLGKMCFAGGCPYSFKMVGVVFGCVWYSVIV